MCLFRGAVIRGRGTASRTCSPILFPVRGLRHPPSSLGGVFVGTIICKDFTNEVNVDVKVDVLSIFKWL